MIENHRVSLYSQGRFVFNSRKMIMANDGKKLGIDRSPQQTRLLFGQAVDPEHPVSFCYGTNCCGEPVLLSCPSAPAGYVQRLLNPGRGLG